jgi:hypothetical protein
MPPYVASRHTKKATTPKLKRQFSHVAKSVMKRTGDEGAAIRAANAVVGRSARKGKRAFRKSSRK